jgi:hypothetical protein
MDTPNRAAGGVAVDILILKSSYVWKCSEGLRARQNVGVRTLYFTRRHCVEMLRQPASPRPKASSQTKVQNATTQSTHMVAAWSRPLLGIANFVKFE